MAKRGDIRARVEGGERVKALFQRLSEAGQGQALERATLAAALPIQNEAKRLAPYRSGTLSRSYTSQVTGRSRTKVVVKVGTSVPYARKQEFGNRPHLRPAFDTKRQEAMETFRDALHDLIEAAR